MGYGDHLMAIGAASRQHLEDPQRRLVAIGDGCRVESDYSDLEHGLSFLANQRTVDAGAPVTWIISYKAFRPYHDHAAMEAQWSLAHPARRRLFGRPDPRTLVDRLGYYVFNPQYRAEPAPLVLTSEEAGLADKLGKKPFVLIEPHIKSTASPSKRWPFERFAAVAETLSREIEIYQVGSPELPALAKARRITTHSFREALPYLKSARLYLGPEGGLHHAAAAMGTPAVVLFGGYVPPSVTGYAIHTNLTGGATACGSQHRTCRHCEAAMANIQPDHVLLAVREILQRPD